MSDLACWRIGTPEEEQVVVRIYGCELSLSQAEALELADHIHIVASGQELESLGEEYQALDECVPRVRVDLAALLGLVQRKEIPRRRL